MKLKFGQTQAEKPVVKKKSAKKSSGRPPLSEEAIASRTEAILQYASDNAAEGFTIGKMAEDLKLTYNIAYSFVNDLKKRKMLDKDFNKGGFSTPKTSQKEVVAKVKPAKKIEVVQDDLVPKELTQVDPFVTQTEMLIFTFVKETRSTDLFEYLTWLEQR